MKRYVADASVILKWVLGDEREADQGKAVALLQDWGDGRAEIFAPSLWQYEVANFLGREIPEEAQAKMTLLLNLNILNVELSDAIYMQCFTWMREDKVTFYDASYLAVAHDIGAVLLTADTKYVSKMQHRGRIYLLKEWNETL